MSGWMSWIILTLTWGLAVVGIGLKAAGRLRHPTLSVGLYLLTGWLGAVTGLPLLMQLPLAGLLWVVAGGLAYTVGAVIFTRERPDPFPQRFGFHGLWHVFVLVGSACHFAFMVFHVVPRA